MFWNRYDCKFAAKTVQNGSCVYETYYLCSIDKMIELKHVQNENIFRLYGFVSIAENPLLWIETDKENQG